MTSKVVSLWPKHLFTWIEYNRATNPTWGKMHYESDHEKYKVWCALPGPRRDMLLFRATMPVKAPKKRDNHVSGYKVRKFDPCTT